MASRLGDSLLVAQNYRGTCRRRLGSLGNLFAGMRFCLFDYVRESCGSILAFGSSSSFVVAGLSLPTITTISVYVQAYLCSSAATQALADSRSTHL